MDKTRQLLQELDVIEKKSESMRRETERLRQLKNDAKATLVAKHPDIFANASTSYRATDDTSKYQLAHFHGYELLS